MEFLASTWLVWLIVGVALYGYAILNQISRMKRMVKTFSDETDPFKGFFKGVVPLVLAWLGGTVSFILAIVGIVASFFS